MKKCNKCEIEKDLSEFYKHVRQIDGFETICKTCKKDYQLRNKEKIKEKKSEYYIENKDKLLECNRNWNKTNLENTRERRKNYYNSNKDKFKKYYLKQKDKKGDESIKYKRNEYKKRKFREDSIFRLKHNLNCYIIKQLKKIKYKKSERIEEILGCDILSFKRHIESKFEPWMSWDNYGLYNGEFEFGWDLDHIIPVSTARYIKRNYI